MIKSFIATGTVKSQLVSVLNDFIVKTSLDSGLFIAGGFAREVCHAHFNLNKTSNNDNSSRIIDYLIADNNSGDIDLFSSSDKVCSKLIKNIEEYVNNLDQLNIYRCVRPYQTEFACNYQGNIKSIFHNKEIKVQIVNKFFFKNIEDCFNSFDVVNCKYAIKKEDKNYVVYYDTEALEADNLMELKLNSSKSPFTISRIVKYIRYRNLKSLSEDKKTQNIFLECLYKAVENNWPSYYSLNDRCFKNSIKNLHNTIGLKPEFLSMFIGFIKEQVVVGRAQLPNNSGYGVYYSNVYKDIDWASNKLINACK